MNRRTQEIITQGLSLAIAIAIVMVVFNALGVFSLPRGDDHDVTYTVVGNTAAAVVTYTQSDGAATMPLDVTLPWKKTVRFDQATSVYLTVGNPSQIGSITCELKLDGEEWKKESAASPDDKISCAGIVP
jgi:hypothetical protein